jgi:hypothetical protein
VRVGDGVGIVVCDGVRVGDGVAVSVGVGVLVGDGIGVSDGVGDRLTNCTTALALPAPAVTPRVWLPTASWGSVSVTVNVPLRRVRAAGAWATAPSHVNARAVRPAKPLPVAVTDAPGAPVVGETLRCGTAAEAVAAEMHRTARTTRPDATARQPRTTRIRLCVLAIVLPPRHADATQVRSLEQRCVERAGDGLRSR